MPRIIDTVSKIDIEKLKTYPKIYEVLQWFIGPNGEVDAQKLPKDIYERLDGWLILTAEPVPPMEQEPPIRETYADDLKRLAEDSKRIRHQREATARLEQYVRERGLLDNEHNANAIKNFIETHPQIKGYWSAVDVIIDFLGPKGSNTLQWQPATPTPAPSKPAEPVELLKDGSPRLPLDTLPQRHHTNEQLRDLDKRLRAARGKHPGQVRFGSKF